MRFGPGYVAGEDAEGGLLSALGTAPLKIAGPLPSKRAVAGGETNGKVEPHPDALHATAVSYKELKSDFLNNPLRLHGLALRAKEAAAVWRLSKGIHNPTLQLHVGETQDFLPNKTLVSAAAVAADAVELARILVLPKGGLRVTGVNAGSMVVRVQGHDGSVDYYTVAVTVATPAGKTPITTRDLSVDQQFWIAGTDWDGDQRQYDQLRRPQWCQLDGCGPTALAMLFGWWDVNGVPSAYYRLEQGKGNAHNFRFNYESLRDSDAPKKTDDVSDTPTNETFIVPVYDDLFHLSNTICWSTSDQGSTPPDQMISAFQEYMGRIHDPQPSPMNEYGHQFVGFKFDKGHVTTPGLGETDWENGGKKVANGIKAGVPGIVGIGSWAGDLHYPLAYGFLVQRLFINGTLANVSQYFKCNMGWGPGSAPEFHRAEDVWFGLTAHLWQTATPTSPNDMIAATFASITTFGSTSDRVHVFTREADRKFQYATLNNPENGSWPAQWDTVPLGEFISGPAACVSGNERDVHVFGRGDDNRIWRAHSSDRGGSWDLAWDPIGDGVFTSSPAACVSADGQSLYVFGRGTDNRIYWSHSPDGAASWDVVWGPIGDGVFTSGPAACVSADGTSLYVFGRGTDNRIYWSHSPDGGASWDVVWGPIGDGIFASSPAAAISADGHSLYVLGRGTDDRIYWSHSPDGGGSWDVVWGPIGDGTFFSSPAVAISPDGKVIHVFGVGKDLQVWRALSFDGGASWSIAWSPIDGGTVF
jgi:hypothetical protein